MKEIRVSRKEKRQQKVAPVSKMKMLSEAFSVFWIIALAGFQLMAAMFRLLRLKKTYSDAKKLSEKSKTK